LVLGGRAERQLERLLLPPVPAVDVVEPLALLLPPREQLVLDQFLRGLGAQHGYHTFPDRCRVPVSLLSTSRRSIRAPTAQTARSTLRALSRCSFPRLTPYLFGLRRALRTCWRSRRSPSCVNWPAAISATNRSAAAVNSFWRSGDRMSQMIECRRSPLCVAHSFSCGP